MKESPREEIIIPACMNGTCNALKPEETWTQSEGAVGPALQEGKKVQQDEFRSKQ